jgi:hypothetical protein
MTRDEQLNRSGAGSSAPNLAAGHLGHFYVDSCTTKANRDAFNPENRERENLNFGTSDDQPTDELFSQITEKQRTYIRTN